MIRALIAFSLTIAAAEPAVHLEIPYRTIGGQELRLDIAVPSEGTGPFPAIVCLHGGGWSMGSKGSYRKYLPEFARLGYAAAGISYRLAPGDPFPAPVEDALAAVSFLRANALRWNLNPKRISILGASAGAHLALLAGFDPKADVEAVIDISGPVDLRDWRMGPGPEKALRDTVGKSSADLTMELLGGLPPEAASPLLYVRKGAPPVFVIHWREDQAVAAAQAERLLRALTEAGVLHEALWFEGRGHALAGKGVEQIVPKTVEFLNRLAQ